MDSEAAAEDTTKDYAAKVAPLSPKDVSSETTSKIIIRLAGSETWKHIKKEPPKKEQNHSDSISTLLKITNEVEETGRSCESLLESLASVRNSIRPLLRKEEKKVEEKVEKKVEKKALLPVLDLQKTQTMEVNGTCKENNPNGTDLSSMSSKMVSKRTEEDDSQERNRSAGLSKLSKLSPGDAVERKIDGVWFNAKVKSVLGDDPRGCYTLEYDDDGHEEVSVPRREIRASKWPEMKADSLLDLPKKALQNIVKHICAEASQKQASFSASKLIRASCVMECAESCRKRLSVLKRSIRESEGVLKASPITHDDPENPIRGNVVALATLRKGNFSCFDKGGLGLLRGGTGEAMMLIMEALCSLLELEVKEEEEGEDSIEKALSPRSMNQKSTENSIINSNKANSTRIVAKSNNRSTSSLRRRPGSNTSSNGSAKKSITTKLTKGGSSKHRSSVSIDAKLESKENPSEVMAMEPRIKASWWTVGVGAIKSDSFHHEIEQRSRREGISLQVAQNTWLLLQRIDKILLKRERTSSVLSPWDDFAENVQPLGKGFEALCHWMREVCVTRRRSEAEESIGSVEKKILIEDGTLESLQATWMSTCRGKGVESYLEQVPAYLRFNYKPKCMESETPRLSKEPAVPAWASWPAPLIS